MPGKKDSGEKKSAKKKKNTSLRLEKEMLKRLKQAALEEETSIQDIIERLIREYLDRHYPGNERSRGGPVSD
jgi:hypothetical protein